MKLRFSLCPFQLLHTDCVLFIPLELQTEWIATFWHECKQVNRFSDNERMLWDWAHVTLRSNENNAPRPSPQDYLLWLVRFNSIPPPPTMERCKNALLASTPPGCLTPLEWILNWRSQLLQAQTQVLTRVLPHIILDFVFQSLSVDAGCGRWRRTHHADEVLRMLQSRMVCLLSVSILFCSWWFWIFK